MRVTLLGADGCKNLPNLLLGDYCSKGAWSSRRFSYGIFSCASRIKGLRSLTVGQNKVYKN